jgi:hypothetical protein
MQLVDPGQLAALIPLWSRELCFVTTAVDRPPPSHPILHTCKVTFGGVLLLTHHSVIELALSNQLGLLMQAVNNKWTGLASGVSIEVTSESNVSGGSDQERRHVRLTDRKLFALAARTASRVDWDAVVARGRTRIISNSSAVHVQQARGQTSVTTSAVVTSSVAEMRSVLHPRTNELYASMMRELYGHEFIYGAIVYRAGHDRLGSADHQSGQALAVAASPSDVDVKTATFTRRHLLALSEQWCFVDALHQLDGGADGGCAKDGFALTMTSLHPDDVFLGKTKASVSALTDFTATYTVLPVSIASSKLIDAEDGKAHVQVTFRAEFEADQLQNARPQRRMLLGRKDGGNWRNISERALVQRLKDMAASTGRLGRIIRRRRLSAQVFVDVKTLHPPNTRCACCTKMLTTILGRNKKQCHLCGFYVCEQCSRQHEIERGRVKRFLVRICEHCLERVDDGIYDSMPADVVHSPSIVDNPPDKSNDLGQLLHETLVQSSGSRKEAAKTIIRHMSDIDAPVAGESRLRAASSDQEYVQALRRVSFQPTTCALANSTTRSYPLQYKSEPERVLLPDAPVPEYEEQRLAFYRRIDLSSLRNLPELDLICELGRKELGCHAGVVSAITGDAMVILASSDPAFKDLVVPREHAICAHTVMSTELPLLLPHPEADVRFTRQNVVRQIGLRFYFGFPLTSADGAAIGTFCCVGTASQTVDKAQYAAVERLARSASRVFQRHVDGISDRSKRSASTV